MAFAIACAGNAYYLVFIVPPHPALLARRREGIDWDARRNAGIALTAAGTVDMLAAAAKAHLHQLAEARHGHGEAGVDELSDSDCSGQLAADVRRAGVQCQRACRRRNGAMSTHAGAPAHRTS